MLKQLPTLLNGLVMKTVINTSLEERITNIRHAITLQLPQIRPFALRHERVVLLGGGPSLNDSIPEIRELLWDGAKLVTTNGTYRWAIEHNLKPSAQVMLDSRDCNASFVDPPVPGCCYYLASQCHPSTFEALRGRDLVALYHCVAGEGDEEIETLLRDYYVDRFHLIGGGSTVVMRALTVLRTLGYFKYDLFGVDSCWLNGEHHAYPQSQNANEKFVQIKCYPTGHPELLRVFTVAPWHIKQLEDFLQLVALGGEHFLINVHGPGLLAYAIQSTADVEFTVEE